MTWLSWLTPLFEALVRILKLIPLGGSTSGHNEYLARAKVLRLINMISDEKMREAALANFAVKANRAYPQLALEALESMPEGPIRDQVLKAITQKLA